jgi:hypothetical protein
MLIAVKSCQLLLDYSLACHIILLHLLSTNHKCTHGCFIKTNAAQNKIISRSSLKILKSTRRMSPSHLPVKLKSAAKLETFIYSLKVKTFGHIIKYYDTLFYYDIVSDIHLYCLSYLWNLILAHI